MRVALQVEEFRRRNPESAQPAIWKRGELGVNAYQLVRMLVWQWPQEHRVDHAEDAGGRANTKRQAQNGREGKAWTRLPHAKSKFEVLPECVHTASEA